MHCVNCVYSVSMVMLIAKHLSVRHIIVRALMGPYSEVVLVCMYVHCMYVCNGFMTEVYEFTYSVCTLRHVPVLVR